MQLHHIHRIILYAFTDTGFLFAFGNPGGDPSGAGRCAGGFEEDAAAEAAAQGEKRSRGWAEQLHSHLKFVFELHQLAGGSIGLFFNRLLAQYPEKPNPARGRREKKARFTAEFQFLLVELLQVMLNSALDGVV